VHSREKSGSPGPGIPAGGLAGVSGGELHATGHLFYSWFVFIRNAGKQILDLFTGDSCI
jgi:hypothetical protein